MKSLARRTSALAQSDIRAISHLIRSTGGINLGQGICDMPTPAPIKAGAHAAIDEDCSIYSHYAGIEPLREAILEKAQRYNRIPATSPEEVVVSVGSTGAFVAAMLSLFDPGDEVILVEPYYGYHRNLLDLLGIGVRTVTTTLPDWAIDLDAIEAAVGPHTKAILVNTPGNPNGKVWTREELVSLVDILERHDLYALTDEIYEYMLYDGREHVSLAALPGAWDRTITISGFSKTYNMTGWRLGYAVGPERLVAPMGLVNDLIYICAPVPLQHGVAEAFAMDDGYFERMQADYARKRTMLCTALQDAGFGVPWPQGAYYVLADYAPLRTRHAGYDDDRQAAMSLVRDAGIGAVAGRSFFENPADGSHLLRFCFAKEFPVLEEACDRLRSAFAR